MLARLSAFVIWALVAATAVFWGLRLFVRPSAPPPYTVAVGDASAMRGDLTRLLGSAPVAEPTATIAPEASARFHLLGIMAPKASPNGGAGQGVALIAVDGNMPKAYAVGASLDGELVLQSVSLRTASIGGSRGGAAAITLELPPPAPAATGTLGGGGGGMPAMGGGRPQITPQITPQFVPQYAPQVGQPVPPVRDARPEDAQAQ